MVKPQTLTSLCGKLLFLNHGGTYIEGLNTALFPQGHVTVSAMEVPQQSSLASAQVTGHTALKETPDGALRATCLV